MHFRLSLLSGNGETLAQTTRFEFHADPWMNLHHLLYHAARNDRLAQEKLRGRVRVEPEDMHPAGLDEIEPVVWSDALEVYATQARSDLLFDATLTEIKQTIAEGETAIRARAESEPLLLALLRAMPVYRRHQWSRHESKHREFIARLQAADDMYGEALANTLAKTYESKWGDTPIRVDIVKYANWAGAYTTYGPNHIVMASSDEQHGGWLGLEILFHEASHTEPLGGKLIDLSRAAAAKAGIEEDRLWHSYIFHASGEAVRRVVDDAHVPYAEAHDLWQRGSMVEHKRVLDAHFNESSLQEQLEQMHAARKETEARQHESGEAE